jgi:glycosyltransferase involved in cell wall biosynthesis
VERERVTILMPLRAHHPRLLREALRSVERQTSPRWRLAVVVEPDELGLFGEVLSETLRDPRVELVANEGRRLAGALNSGLRAARSDFTAILFGDDMWATTAVERLTAAIEDHPDADFLHTGRVVVDEDGAEVSRRYGARERVTAADFALSSPVKHLLCWRRELGLAVGGIDESLDSVGPDDYDFPWTMAEAGARFLALQDCLYRYRDHRECFRLTTHLPLTVHRRGIRRIMEKHGASEEAIRQRLEYAEATYLRQCLYDSDRDRRSKERSGVDPRSGWRETYA